MRRLPIVLAATWLLVLAGCSARDAEAATRGDPAAVTTAAPLLPPGDAVASATTSTAPPTTTTTTTTAPPTATTTTTTTTTMAPVVGVPHGEVEGLTMFRGNPSRTYYGSGAVPDAMTVRWRFPESPMCGNSPVGGEPKQWCGTGWTGQPVVWERPDGVTEVIFGAYDKRIHFVDAASGDRTRPAFSMGDIIKGSVTLDPDGYPLLFAGSRHPRFRVIALDREVPTELWSLDAASVPGMWNNDWDSNPVVVDGVLYVGGENSWWFAIELNRRYDDDGLVTAEPMIVYATPAFTDELVARVGRQQSVENSTAVFGDRAYFATSAGRVVGVDISTLPGGPAEIVFDFWMGDDVDATLVVDETGALYVAAQIDLATQRGRDVGQLVKLDPTRPDDPIVWSQHIPAANGVSGGVWATPALVDDILFVATNPGELLAVETATGEIVWRDDIGTHAWSSPVHAGDRLVVAVNCDTVPALRVYDVRDPRRPEMVGEEAFAGGCIESTPALWKGSLYVGSRDGFFYALGSP